MWVTLLIIDQCQFTDNNCTGVYIFSHYAKILNSQFKNSTSEDGIAIYNFVVDGLYLSNNTVNTEKAEILAVHGTNITSEVTVTIMDNRTVYKHLNEDVLIYLTFHDDNSNLIELEYFDLLVNNTKVSYVYNNSTQQYEANFTADKTGSYYVSIDDIRFSNMTFKNAEIVVVNITDDFSTLQKLIDNANGTLTLTKNYTFNPLTDEDLVNGSLIEKNIIMDGAGFTLNGNNQASILYVESGEVTIKNINFINANTSFDAGAIFWNLAHGKISNCTFINNNADSGSAIWSYAKVDVANCNFINNTAGEYGGALYIYYNGNVTNCNFTDNKLTGSSSRGGAVYFFGLGECIITNCNFTQNIATYGGAVYSFYGESSVLNCNFADNTASDWGGAVFFNGQGNVTNCNFTNNSAKSGGAIRFIETGDVTNCNFADNSASSTGGAIYFISNGNVSNCNFTNNKAAADNSIGGAVYFDWEGNVTNCNFTDNIASICGGAVYFGWTGNVSNCNFANNSVSRAGGAVGFNTKGNVINCNFTNNSATNGNGGAILIGSGTVTNCYFTNNSADEGGAIYLWRADNKISNCVFSDNFADKGGAMYFAESDGTIEYSQFTNNTAFNGGAIYCDESNLTVISSNFTNNSARGFDSFGGAIVFYGEDLIIDDSKFISNEAYGCGAVAADTSTAKITNTEFIKNGAYDNGALGVSSGNVLIDNCEFNSNYANESVAALFLYANTIVNNTVFKGNRAKDSGALYFKNLSNGTLIIDQCQFIDNDCTGAYLYAYQVKILNSQFTNSTSEDGVAIYNSAINTLYLSNNTVSTDKAEIFSVYGGDITSNVTVTILDNKTVYKYINETVLIYLTFCDDKGNLIQVQDFDLLVNNTKVSYVYNNSTQQYEANFTADKTGSYPVSIADIHLSNLTFRNAEIVVFEENDFTTLQKLIDNANDTLTLTKDYTFNPYMDVDFDCIWIEKNITIDGAGFTLNGNNQASIFYVVSDNVTIKNIIFINANISDDGGAIYWKGDYAKLSNCTFINNTAREYGGAVYIKCNGNVSNCNFTDNKLTGGFSLGGAVYFNGMGDGTITNCNFIGNIATYGGAVYYFDGNSTVSNCNFINNKATDSTGAIGIKSGIVTNCNFINNKATDSTGAIGMHYGDITNCNFTNNSAGEGGAIYFWMGDNKVSNCNFAGNSAKLGGAIYGDNVLYVENSQFSENDAYQDGGAIFSISNLTVVGCQFNNNYAGFSAGAIASPENIKVINSNFTSNRAELLAGAILVNNTIGIDNCNFVNNTAGSTAGAVLVYYDLKVTNSSFTDNSAERGGAIAVVTANISDSNFTSNNADYGGAIFAAGNVTINNCGFEENAAESEGGAISFRPEIDNATLSINGSTFTKNTAVCGGALAITENTTITNSNFINNTAEDGSDNIVTYDDANLTLENVSPDNLTALAYVDLTAGASYVKYGNPVEIKVAVTKDGIFISEGSVSVVFNNETYSADVVNGSATIKIPNVDAGYYSDVKVTYNGNGKYTNSFDTVSFYVLQSKTTVTAAAKTYVINYGGKYSVTLKDENGAVVSGKTLTLTINGKEYKATSNANGVATFSLTKAILKSAGTKTVTVKFAGDTNYVGSNATVKITVNKEKTKILKAKKTYKFKKSKKTKNIKVTLKNSKNKVMKKVKVTIKLSGKKIKGKKTVTAKTNNKGVVTFKLGKKLTKKTKVKYTITYKGNSYYNKVTKKGTIKIK